MAMSEEGLASPSQDSRGQQDRHLSDSLQLNAIEVVDDGNVDLLAIIRKVHR